MNEMLRHATADEAGILAAGAENGCEQPERAIGVSALLSEKGVFDVLLAVMKEDTAGPMKCSKCFHAGQWEPLSRRKSRESSMLFMGSSANRI